MLLLPATAAARVTLYCGALVLHSSYDTTTRAFAFSPSVPATIYHYWKSEPSLKHDPRRWQQRSGEHGYLAERKKSVQRQQELCASPESASSGAHSPSPIVPVATVASGFSEQDERQEKRAGRGPLKLPEGSAPPSSRGSETPVDDPSPPLDVLNLNEDFAAICKPPLMHVHRPEFGTKDKEFVMQKARNQLGRRIFLPHRLDRGTSGCLLLGFSSEAVKVLHHALAHPSSSKTYVAIVRGSGQAYIGKGWFTVDRAIKDDKKILREASTRFLFVKGGDDPDPRCCLVLAQPSTGRFHQIRRHLNGLSHPIVGDSVHGSSRFNREVAAHRNPAPAGRLMLHCLRLSLPTLPDAGSRAWRSAAGGELSSSVAAAAAEGVSPENGETSENVRAGQEMVGEINGASCGGSESQEAGLSQGEGRSARVDAGGAATPGSKPTEGNVPTAQKHAISEASESIVEGSPEPGPARTFSAEPDVYVRAEKSGVGVSPSTVQDATAAASGGPVGNDAGSEKELLEGTGFGVYSEPPNDMMEFLRGMSWWEEGMIQAAERSAQREPPASPVL